MARTSQKGRFRPFNDLLDSHQVLSDAFLLLSVEASILGKVELLALHTARSEDSEDR